MGSAEWRPTTNRNSRRWPVPRRVALGHAAENERTLVHGNGHIGELELGGGEPEPKRERRDGAVAGRPGDHAHHECHHLGRGVRGFGVNPVADQAGKSEASGQGGHQQQARIGHQVRVIEDHLNPVGTMARCVHRKCLSDLSCDWLSTPSFSHTGRHFLRIRDPAHPYQDGGSRLKASQERTTSSNLTDPGWVATHTSAMVSAVGGVTLRLVDVAGLEATSNVCGVGVARLQGHSWTPTPSTGSE